MKRAVSDVDKQQREQDIINTAEKLFLNADYRDITMAKIAQDAGVAKGTLFIYFQTKEELFISLAEKAIANWSQGLQTEMKNIITIKKNLKINEFVDMLICSIESRVLVKLFSILDDTLEQNIDMDRAYRFKTFLKGEMSELGLLIETVLPAIPGGQGSMILSQLFICLIGAYKVSNPAPIVKQVIRRPGLEMFDRDFITTMKEMATYYISGYIALHRME